MSKSKNTVHEYVNGEVIFHDELIFRDHFERIYAFLVYPPNIVVSGSTDSTIKIYDLENKSTNNNHLVHTIFDFKKSIYRLMKFSSNSFFACGEDYYVRGYSFNEKFEFTKIFELRMKNKIQNLLKLKNNLFLAVIFSSNEPLLVLDADSQKIVKFMKNENQSVCPCGISISQNYPNCFYFSTTDFDKKVKLINYEIDKTIRIFNSHGSRAGRNLKLFKDFKNSEILVVASMDGIIYFYDTETAKVIQKIKTFDTPFCLWVVNKYLFVGERGGYFEAFILKSQSNTDGERISFKKICERKNFHSNHFSEIRVLEKERNRIKICSCSFDNSVKVINLVSRLFNFNDDERDPDEIERMEYVREFNCFEEVRLKMLFISFKINKIFLCL